jgi:hypothetical protein
MNLAQFLTVAVYRQVGQFSCAFYSLFPRTSLMQYKIAISPRTLAIRLTVIALVLTLISIGIQVSKYVFSYRSEWMDMWNLDREMNVPTWFKAFMLVFCALLLGAIAIGKKKQGDRFSRHWQLLSLIFWLMSLDEVVSIHEIMIVPSVADALNFPGFLRVIWVIPFGILLMFFARHYWKFTMHYLPKRSRFHFILAFAIYVGGAWGMEMVGSQVAKLEGQQHLTYALVATLEEVMQMMGTIVFIYGLLFYIGRWQKEVQLQIQILGGKNSPPDY